MENNNGFIFKLSQSKKIDILKSFEIDSQRLISSTQIVLQKRNYWTEGKNNSINFNYSPRYTTHSGKNGIEGIKVFRKGFFEFKKTHEEKIELNSRINLIPLISLAALTFLFSCLIGLLSSSINGKIGFIVFGLALFGFIIILGRQTIKHKISSIIKEVMNTQPNI